MAGLIITFSTDEIALSAGTAKTALQIKAAANQRAKIKAWGVYFDGISSSAEPVQVRLLRQTTVIGGTPTAITGRKQDPGADETVQTTGAIYGTSPSEPTPGEVLKGIEVHPQSGYEEACPFGDEYIVGGGGYAGIECNAPAGVNVRAWMRCEE